MKKSLLILLLAACSLSVAAQRQVNESQRQALEARKAGGETLARYKAGLYAKLTGKSEKVYLDVAQSFYYLEMEATQDSILTVAKKKFPNGELVRNGLIRTIYDEKDPVKQEAAFKAWIKRFPPEKLGENIVYDYARQSVASSYAENGNVAKTMEYVKSFQHPGWRSEGISATAKQLLARGDLGNAAVLFKMAVDNSEKLRDEGHKDAWMTIMAYDSYLSNYADVCYRLGRKAEALETMEKVKKEKRNETYFFLLGEQGRPLEAFLGLNDLVRAGNTNSELLKEFQKLYVKLNGSDKGYDSYITGMQQARAEARTQELVKSMISEPAPDFTLTDMTGKVVKLSDLKGKVVVLDFWATWCGPCKQSFPAMQKAVTKYKDDPDVEFLFIHTWEKEDNPTAEAIKFLGDNGYTFRLLMDLKDPETKANKVVSSFKVQGIPTKFVIDPKGQIRFKSIGGGSNEEELVSEMSQMIEMARKAAL